MSSYLDKFWKFWDRFWKLCRWLEGAEGIGMVEKTRNLEGTFTRTRQEGCLEILKEKFKGVADEKRLEEVLTSETVLVVKCKEAEEELFNPMWEIIYRRSEMREEWVLTLPLEATTLASAEHFTIPKSSTPEADWVVARSAGVIRKPKKFKTVWHGVRGILKLSGRVNQARLKLSAGFSNTVCWTS